MEKIDLNQKIRKIADNINKKRRKEIIDIYNSTELFSTLKNIKDQDIYTKGNKSKTMRAVASFPVEIDMFFEKIYGEDYYKDPDFFKKYAPEWLVVDAHKL